MARIIPNLGLQDLADNELDGFAQDKVDKISKLEAFNDIEPTVAEVENKNKEYRDALSDTQGGNSSDTETKNKRRGELEELLTAQAADAAKIADGDLALYLKTGYKAKDTQGTPVGELDAPENILFDDYGKNPDELRPNWDVVENAKTYVVQVFTDTENPDETVIAEDIVSPSKAIIKDLPGGAMVWVRVRAIGGSEGKGPWSDPAQKRVP